MAVQLASVLAQSLYLRPSVVVLQEYPCTGGLGGPDATSATEERAKESKSTLPWHGTAGIGPVWLVSVFHCFPVAYFHPPMSGS
jgi:hypothetical protein